jgi:serine protease Do
MTGWSTIHEKHAVFKTVATCLAWGLCLLTPSLLLANTADPLTTPFDKAQDRLRAGFAAVVEQAKRGTVGILTQSTQPNGKAFSVRGSGIYLGDGYILTARHATKHQGAGTAADPPHVSVIAGTLEEAPAALVGVNHFLDVALYRISQEKVPHGLAARTFSQTPALPGERVFTVGYPLGWGPAISYGRIGNPTTFLQTVQSRLLQVDLSACSGNSGGGLFNARGEIVGLVHAIIQTETVRAERRCSRFAFAVPGPLVHKIVTALKQGRPFHFSKLGLQLTSVKFENRWHMAVAQATGPARRAGFKKGDVLLSIDDQPINSASQLKTYVIEHTRPMQPVSIRILRQRKERVLRVILEKALPAPLE